MNFDLPPNNSAVEKGATTIFLPDPTSEAPPIRETAHEAAYTWDLIGDGLLWSGNLAEALGIGDPAALATGRGYADRLARDARLSRYAAVQNSAAHDAGDGVAFHAVYRMIADSGHAMWVEDVGRWFAGADGRPACVRGTIRVVTDHYEQARRVAEQARIDPLTGALTRQALCEHVGRLLARPVDRKNSFAVLLVGIENLIQIEARHGRGVADSLLAGVARRIREQMRSNDVIARYAGDRLVLVLDACVAARLERAAKRQIAIVDEAPVVTSMGALPARLRIGAVMQPKMSRGPEALLEQAEAALERAQHDDPRRSVAGTPSRRRAGAG